VVDTWQTVKIGLKNRRIYQVRLFPKLRYYL